MEDSVELLHVPCWPGPSKLVVDEGYVGELRSLNRPISGYLAGILERCLSERGGEVNDGRKKILWDPACIAAVADPEAVTTYPLAVPTLDAAGAHDFSRRGREVETVTDLAPERVLVGLWRALERYLAASGA